MTEPTKLIDMTPEEREKVIAAIRGGVHTEVYLSHAQQWVCYPPSNSVINLCGSYRVAPRKPSIDWSHVGDEWNHLVTHISQNSVLCPEKPEIGCRHWLGGGRFISADGFASYVPGTCHWTESLVSRPGYEGDEQ